MERRNRESAERLGISPRTIQKHLQLITPSYERKGGRRRSLANVFALRCRTGLRQLSRESWSEPEETENVLASHLLKQSDEHITQQDGIPHTPWEHSFQEKPYCRTAKGVLATSRLRHYSAPQSGLRRYASMEKNSELLTRREAEVLKWVRNGKTNKDIAAILGIQPRTVSKHLERIFKKLGVDNRTAAAMSISHE